MTMQQTDSKYPNLIVRKGSGTFSTSEMTFEAGFEICHYPQSTIIKTILPDKYTTLKLILHQGEDWQLIGLIEEKIQIVANNLFVKKISGNKLSLFSFQNLYFGSENISKISFARFPLVGTYNLDFDIEIDGWRIKSIGEKEELEQIKTKSKNWNLQFEGNILIIETLNATEDEYLKKANDITSLLSLALGNEIIFNRQLYFREKQLIREVWQRKIDYYFGTYPCVPYFKIDLFLSKTLTNFENWDKKKKKIFFSTVTYLNSTSKGYLEDRLLTIGIAWEALAQKWLTKKNDLGELDPLKATLKKTINEFNLPKSYEKEFVIERVLKSLDWEKNINKLISFCDQFRLDNDKLGLDFKSLNKIRNDIAHTGLFREKYSEEFLTKLLKKHTLGLQIILLLELEYDGLIQTDMDKWKTYIKIDEMKKLNQS